MERINTELLFSDLDNEDKIAIVDTIKNVVLEKLEQSLYSFLNNVNHKYEIDRLIAEKAENIIEKIKICISELVNEEFKDLDKEINDFKVCNILRNYDKQKVD